MPKPYRYVRDGEWVYPVHEGYLMRCCDCHLIHRVNFKIVVEPDGTHAVAFQAFRERRKTASARRSAIREPKTSM